MKRVALVTYSSHGRSHNTVQRDKFLRYVGDVFRRAGIECYIPDPDPDNEFPSDYSELVRLRMDERFLSCDYFALLQSTSTLDLTAYGVSGLRRVVDAGSEFPSYLVLTANKYEAPFVDSLCPVLPLSDRLVTWFSPRVLDLLNPLVTETGYTKDEAGVTSEVRDWKGKDGPHCLVEPLLMALAYEHDKLACRVVKGGFGVMQPTATYSSRLAKWLPDVFSPDAYFSPYFGLRDEVATRGQSGTTVAGDFYLGGD